VTALSAVFAGVLGAAVGSFLNVVVHRVPRGQSLLRPPSSCPGCGTPIRPRDNVPILSFVLLGGRCRSCGARISGRYPLVEATTTAVWVGSILRYGPSEEAAFVAVGGSVLLALAMIDLEHRRLPNVIVLPAIAGAAVWVITLGAVERTWRMVVVALASGAAAFVLLLAVALVSGGMGMGDVKLAGFVGMFTGRFGADVAVAGILAAFIVGGIVAVALLATGARGRKDALPFGPSFGAGALAAVFLGADAIRALLGF
jgi:leader peptidase (prepilin peptidase)/N-methyltransferase